MSISACPRALVNTEADPTFRRHPSTYRDRFGGIGGSRPPAPRIPHPPGAFTPKPQHVVVNGSQS